MELTLQRIWSQCLGIADIDPNTNFFEVGGDSLIAISVAMTASKEGLDLTPQDLYENQNRRSSGQGAHQAVRRGRPVAPVAGRCRPPADTAQSRVLPRTGSPRCGSWRTPLILRLRPDLDAEDVRAVLTAVTSLHDALRLRVVENADVWDQRFDEPGSTPA